MAAKILLVDDDEDLRELITEVLQLDDHLVESVGDGLTAKAMLLANQYDVVVLDWDLPGMSGLEVCSGYRAVGGSGKVLLLTGMASESAKSKAIDSGANSYLTKPFSLEDLSGSIRNLLDKR
jgi:OmpR-family two-component system manganese-sensing response regulator